MKLKDSQKRAVLFIVNHKRTLYRAPTGSGKTYTVLTAIKVLQDRGFVKLPIIVAKPKELLAYKLKKNNVYGFEYQCLEEARDWDLWLGKNSNWQGRMLLVASTMITKYPAKFLELAVRSDFMGLEEVHNWRVRTNQTTQLLRRAVQYYKGRLVSITASPFYRALENIFDLMSLVQPGVFQSWEWFENNFIIYQEREIMTKRKVMSAAGITKERTLSTIKDKIGYKNTDQLMKMIEPYVFYTADTKFTILPEVVQYDITPEVGQVYNEAVQGLGLKTVVYQVTYWDYVKQKEYEVSRDHTEGLWDQEQKNIILAPNLKTGQIVNIDGAACMIRGVREVDARADFFKRLIELQRILLPTEGKIGTLVKLVEQEGALVYCNFLDSADYVVEQLKQRLPGRRVVKLVGSTDKRRVAGLTKSLNPEDIAVITRACSQSLNFYFQQVILYEQITVPGLLEQLTGRCTREDATFTELKLIFLCCRKTIEEYLYSRCRAETDQLPGAMLQNKLPELPGYAGISLWDFRMIKDRLLWQDWRAAS